MNPARDGPQRSEASSDNIADSSEQRKILLRRRAAAFGLTSLLLLATLLWTASDGLCPSAEAFPAVSREQQLLTGVDPNTARWFELAQLPGIGETLARRMEEFRRRSRSQDHPSAPVFRSAADLAQVRGIGEKTVQRIGPFLRFADSGALR